MKSGGTASHIGSLNEKPLHAALKQWCAGPSARFEVKVDGFFIDVVQGDLLIEIQTKNFASIRRKLVTLTQSHRVRLLYPVAHEKWIVKEAKRRGKTGKVIRRKSPKRGDSIDVFNELVSIPKLLAHPNFSLMVVLIREEEVRRFDKNRAWRRRGWVTQERRLIEVVDHHLFESPGDLAALIPTEVPDSFTTLDLAGATGKSRWLAQKMAYCLREIGVIEQIGMQSRAILYKRVSEARTELRLRAVGDG